MSYERDLAETQNANVKACIAARKAAGIPDVDDVTDIDCHYECKIWRTTCPFRAAVIR